MTTEQNIKQVSLRDLENLAPESATLYDLQNTRRSILKLSQSHAHNFKNVCKVLQNLLKPAEGLWLDFHLNTPHLESLANLLLENHSITSVDCSIRRSIDLEAFRRFSAILSGKNKIIKKIHFVVSSDLPSILNSIKGLHLPTKLFVLDIWHSYDNITSEFFSAQVEVLQTTNINALLWFSLDYTPPKLSGESLLDFGKLCDYITKQNTLKVFHLSVDLGELGIPYMARLISIATNLRDISLEFAPSVHAPKNFQDLLDALSKSNLRQVHFQGLAENLRKESWEEVAASLSLMKHLTSLAISVQKPAWSFLALKQSESLRKFTFNDQIILDPETGANIFDGNIKRQNSRVRDLITLLFNIARDKSSDEMNAIPRDVWPSIASFVSIPGVSLDFGDIARSIFKDHTTIRRVISKPAKKHLKDPMESKFC